MICVGDTVEKVTGDYRIRGVVRAVFEAWDGGPLRLVVAHEPKEGSGYFLHIYAPAQLRRVE